jgi:hypothetical protein
LYSVTTSRADAVASQAYIRALVKEGTASSEAELIHDHEEAGPFLHPKLALHMAQWCNPAFAAVVNGWVLRFIAADRTLADDIQRRAGSGAGMETLGSSLTHTMRDVPMLPTDSQPRGGELDVPMPPTHEVEASAAAGPPASKAPSRRKAPAAASIPPVALEEEEAEEAPLAEEEEVSEEESEEEEALPPVKTPATRQPRRARTGGKSTPAAKAKGAKGVAKGGVKRRRKHQESYGVYLHRVLKQIHPELGISSKAMEVMNVRHATLRDCLLSSCADAITSTEHGERPVRVAGDGGVHAGAEGQGAHAVGARGGGGGEAAPQGRPARARHERGRQGRRALQQQRQVSATYRTHAARRDGRTPKRRLMRVKQPQTFACSTATSACLRRAAADIGAPKRSLTASCHSCHRPLPHRHVIVSCEPS